MNTMELFAVGSGHTIFVLVVCTFPRRWLLNLFHVSLPEKMPTVSSGCSDRCVPEAYTRVIIPV